jgi:hypothetical protein
MGKPLPLTLLGVINPCHLHDPNGMSQPDDINKTLSKHGVHFATNSETNAYMETLSKPFRILGVGT